MDIFVAIDESFGGNGHYHHRDHHLHGFQGFHQVHFVLNEVHKDKDQMVRIQNLAYGVPHSRS